uniref:Uncharacterized protein n=1 Tax=Anguilla anguilla TaxID=7936 RepID=A0A0E9UVI6_ANGAN
MSRFLGLQMQRLYHGFQVLSTRSENESLPNTAATTRSEEAESGRIVECSSQKPGTSSL